MAGTDDLLSPDEIEALIQAARADSPAPGPARAAGSDLLDAGEIEALMQGKAPPPRQQAPARPRAASAAESSLHQAESQLAAAMSHSGSRGIPAELGSPSPFNFQDFTANSGAAAEAFPLSALQDVELDLRIELGRTELLIDEVLKLREGSVVPLDKLAGDPVDILVNGQLIARGEVLVLNDNFCVRVAEILTPDA